MAGNKGITGISADVLCDNKSMLKVYEKLPFPIQSRLELGVYHLLIKFSDDDFDLTNKEQSESLNN